MEEDGRDLVTLLLRMYRDGSGNSGGGGSGEQEVSGARDKSINTRLLCYKMTIYIYRLILVSDFTRTCFLLPFWKS